MDEADIAYYSECNFIYVDDLLFVPVWSVLLDFRIQQAIYIPL